MEKSAVMFNLADDEFGWLSNMNCDWHVRYKGIVYPSAEHLFQYLRYEQLEPVKLMDRKLKREVMVTKEGIRDEILAQPSPMIAKRVAKRFRKLIGEEDNKSKAHDCLIMKKVLGRKLAYNPDLFRKLISIREDMIIEDATNRVQKGKVDFWGAALQEDGTWVGDNMLGKIWIQMRDDLRKALGLRD